MGFEINTINLKWFHGISNQKSMIITGNRKDHATAW